MNRWITISLFLLCAGFVQGQNEAYIDSLWTAYHESDQDTTRLQLRLEIAQESYTFRPTLWDSIVKEAQKLDMPHAEGIAWNNLSLIQRNLGNVPYAIECMHNSLKIKERMGDERGIAKALNALGVYHDDQNDTTAAFKYLHRSLEIREKLGDRKEMAPTYNNLGSMYKKSYRYDKALEHLKKARNIYIELNESMYRTTVTANIGVLFMDIENYDSAKVYLEEALVLAEENGRKDLYASSLAQLGTVYFHRGQLGKALNNGLKAMEMAQEVKYPDEIKKAASLLTKVYRAQGNYQQALAMRELFVLMRDSIQSVSNKREAIKQQMQHQFERQSDSLKADQVKQDAIAKADRLKKQQVAEAERKRKKDVAAKAAKNKNIIIWTGSGGLLLVLLFGAYVLSRLRTTRRQKNIIEEQKFLVEEQKFHVEEKNREIVDSIRYAKRLQEAILPPPEFVQTHLPESFILYKPKDIVAGDFYWMEVIDDTIYLAAADCTGHGVPGAMVSVVCSNALSKALLEEGIREPGRILDRTRELVIERFDRSDTEVKDGMDVALVALQQVKAEGQRTKAKVSYAGANNPLWVIREGTDVVEEYKPDKQPVGAYSEQNNFTTQELEVGQGDLIYLFTDGYPDQFGGTKGKKFKTANLKQLLITTASKSAQAQHDELDTSLAQWQGDLEQVDDVCVIGVRL